MLIFVDTDTGTWGGAEKNLVIFDASDDDLEWLEQDHSDSEINEFGNSKREQ